MSLSLFPRSASPNARSAIQLPPSRASTLSRISFPFHPHLFPLPFWERRALPLLLLVASIVPFFSRLCRSDIIFFQMIRSPLPLAAEAGSPAHYYIYGVRDGASRRSRLRGRHWEFDSSNDKSGVKQKSKLYNLPPSQFCGAVLSLHQVVLFDLPVKSLPVYS